MTTHESFKKRVRARMVKTGERYVAARRAMLDTTPTSSRREWISQPEMSDEAVTSGTGRGWDDWCDVIDAWPGHRDGHAAVAAHLGEAEGLDGWWAQTVTVGWERISGRRLLHQMADGTFSASTSRTLRRAEVGLSAEQLRAILFDDADRAELLGFETSLRSKPVSKSLRFAAPEGALQFDVADVDDERIKVGVTHSKLTTPDEIARWKFHWAEWLDAIEGSAQDVVD